MLHMLDALLIMYLDLPARMNTGVSTLLKLPIKNKGQPLHKGHSVSSNLFSHWCNTS